MPVEQAGRGETAAGAPTAGQGGEPPSVFGDEADQREPEFQAALAALRKPSRVSAGLLLVGSLVAFLVFGKGEGGFDAAEKGPSFPDARPSASRK